MSTDTTLLDKQYRSRVLSEIMGTILAEEVTVE